jgi:hypothetical protein
MGHSAVYFLIVLFELSIQCAIMYGELKMTVDEIFVD